MELSTNFSLFLRPFIAFDNGVVVAGVTTFGTINFGRGAGAFSQGSTVGPRDVQIRVDKQGLIELSALGNPESGISLPGFVERRDTPAGSSISTDPFQSMFESETLKNSPYVLAVGEKAEVLLEQMLTGTKIQVRRKPDPMWAAVGLSYTQTKVFSLGESFRSGLTALGARKNADTGRWELDPGKKASRDALMIRATANSSATASTGKKVQLRSGHLNDDNASTGTRQDPDIEGRNRSDVSDDFVPVPGFHGLHLRSGEDWSPLMPAQMEPVKVGGPDTAKKKPTNPRKSLNFVNLAFFAPVVDLYVASAKEDVRLHYSGSVSEFEVGSGSKERRFVVAKVTAEGNHLYILPQRYIPEKNEVTIKDSVVKSFVEETGSHEYNITLPAPVSPGDYVLMTAQESFVFRVIP